MKMLGKIGMFLAVSILMLHSVMPHQHHDQNSDERHAIEYAQAESLVDYILLAFHVNPGEKHLEEFEKASTVSLLFISAELSDYQFGVRQEEIALSNWVEYPRVIMHQSLSGQLSFRGPPQLV